MKRSEMVEKLRNRMNNVLSEFYSLEEADMLLEFLERQGMKPPVEKRCPVLLTNTHVWENENAQS